MRALKYGVLLMVLSIGWISVAHAFDGQKTVYLQNNQEQKLAVAQISFAKVPHGSRYDIQFNEELFGDYFLSMRPFRCHESERLVCRQPYPYDLPRVITKDDFRSLQHDLLFVTRELAGYGIDPYHGRYYVMTKQGDRLIGRAFGVDLNDIAAPPEKGILYPFTKDLIDEMEPQSVQFPVMIIE